MLSNFDRKTLAAFNSLRLAAPEDFDRMVEGLKDEEGRLSEQERGCKDEISLRWIQGARQTLADLVHQAENARHVLVTLHEHDEEKKRDAGIRGRAIG